MSNIITFPRRRPQQAQTQSTAFEAVADFPAPTVNGLDSKSFLLAQTRPSKPVEALEASLDAHRSTLLELAHRKQAFEMQMMLENNTAQIKLEAAAYRALVAGVPESDIYALGEDMAEALSSAMETVAGA